MLKRAVKTHNASTWTSAQFFSFIRSMLRRGTFRWIPIKNAKLSARIPWPGPHGRKYGYKCAICGGTFPDKKVHVDHVVPCGSLKSLEDVAGFISRTYAEDPANYMVLCKGKGSCHQKKTNEEKSARTKGKPST